MFNQHLEEILDEFGIPHDVPAEQLLPVLFVVRAFRKKIPLEFDDSGVHYTQGIDSQLDEIYSEAVRRNSNPDYDFSDMKSIYDEILAYPKYFEEQPIFSYDFMDACDPPFPSNTNPSLVLVNLMSYAAGIHGDNTRVYNPYGGAISFAIFTQERGRHEGLVQIESYTHSLFAREALDAFGLDKIKVETCDSSRKWSNEQFDVVMTVLPDFPDMKLELYHTIKNLSARTNSQKKAVIIVPEPFLWMNVDVIEKLRAELCESGYLYRISRLPNSLSYSPYVTYKLGFIPFHQNCYMIELDYSVHHSSVEFADLQFLEDNSYGIPVDEHLFDNIRERIKVVPISDIKQYDYCLVPLMYEQRISENDDYKTVSLSELVDICELGESNYVKLQKGKINLPLVDLPFSDKLSDAITRVMERIEYDNSWSSYGYMFIGPHIHYYISGAAFSNKEDISYVIQDADRFFTFSLKDSRVSQDYLTYVLLNDRLFAQKCDAYQRFTRAYELNNYAPPISIIMSHRVKILKDRNKQEQIITEAIDETVKIAGNGLEYNVLWVAPDAEAVVNASNPSLKEWRINVVEKYRSASALSKTDILAESADTVDAIIVDVSVPLIDGTPDEEEFEGFEHIIDLRNSITEREIPFYVYTPIDPSNLKRYFRKSKLSYFVEHDRYFLSTDDLSLKILVSRMREELDQIGSIHSKITNKFKKELEAIPDYKHDEYTKALSQCMYEEFLFSNGDVYTENKFNDLRKIVEDIFESCSNYKILPKMDFGATIQFILDEAYVDDKRKKAHFLRFSGPGVFMHKTLRYSLVYLKDILNGGSHKDDEKRLDVGDYIRSYKTANLYKSAVYIILDLMIWYKSIVDIQKSNKGLVFFESIDTLPLFNHTYTVRRDGDYWYCDCFHLKFRRELKVGATIKVMRCAIEKNPRLEGVVFFTDSYVIM